MRVKQLRLLIEIERHDTLHKAADAIAITQPGATKALRDIEEMLGTPLFERQSTGLVANEMGRCVSHYARLIYSDLEHLREEVAGIIQGEGERLCVGVVMGAIPDLTAALARLRSKQPRLVASTSVPVLTVAVLDLSCIVTTSNSARSSLYATSNLLNLTKAVRSGVASLAENRQKQRNEARSSSASASFASDRSYQRDRSRSLNIANGGQAGPCLRPPAHRSHYLLAYGVLKRCSAICIDLLS
jgi:DNA-binding transcriptional LysR family regulator